MDTILLIACITAVASLIINIVLLQAKNKTAHNAGLLQAEINHLKGDINYKVAQQISEKEQQLKHTLLELERKCAIMEAEGYKRGREEAVREFKRDHYVVVHPVKEVYEEGIDLLVYNSKKTLINVGYQYQLYVKGIPVFEPAVVIVETHEIKDKKLNEEAINRIVTTAIEAYKPAAGSFIKLGNKILSRQKPAE